MYIACMIHVIDDVFYFLHRPYVCMLFANDIHKKYVLIICAHMICKGYIQKICSHRSRVDDMPVTCMSFVPAAYKSSNLLSASSSSSRSLSAGSGSGSFSFFAFLAFLRLLFGDTVKLSRKYMYITITRRPTMMPSAIVGLAEIYSWSCSNIDMFWA